MYTSHISIHIGNILQKIEMKTIFFFFLDASHMYQNLLMAKISIKTCFYAKMMLSISSYRNGLYCRCLVGTTQGPFRRAGARAVAVDGANSVKIGCMVPYEAIYISMVLGSVPSMVSAPSTASNCNIGHTWRKVKGHIFFWKQTISHA